MSKLFGGYRNRTEQLAAEEKKITGESKRPLARKASKTYKTLPAMGGTGNTYTRIPEFKKKPIKRERTLEEIQAEIKALTGK